jgi:hypothetical protein
MEHPEVYHLRDVTHGHEYLQTARAARFALHTFEKQVIVEETKVEH